MPAKRLTVDDFTDWEDVEKRAAIANRTRIIATMRLGEKMKNAVYEICLVSGTAR